MNSVTSLILCFSHLASQDFASVLILALMVGRFASLSVSLFGRFGRFITFLMYLTCDDSHFLIIVAGIVMVAAFPCRYSVLAKIL